jgi:nitrogenase subunit NifH
MVINNRLKDWNVPLYHSIPFDPEVGKADLNGSSPLDFNPDSDAINSLQNLYRKLKALKEDIFDL